MTIKIKTKGKYNITYQNIEHSFEGGNEYIVDEETAKMLVEGNFASYVKLEKKNDKNKSIKTN